MKGILEYLERSSECFPEKTAVACRDRSYTFLELKAFAQAVGAELAKHVGPGKPVAVMVDRCADTPGLFLGAAYNGDFYVPVDPSMPREKIRSVLDDSGAKVVLGTGKSLHLVRELGFSGTILDFCTIENGEIPAPAVFPDTPLYMVYTSGSTGKPKGVLKSHGAVMSFIEAYAAVFNLSDEEIIGNQTPLFFDASAKDIYQMLFTGASLEIIPSEYFMLPTALIPLLNEKKITYICWVPTALSMVVQMNAFRKVLPETLRNVFFVGEVFPSKQLRAWTEALPEARFVNLYGSSEIAGICMYYEIDKAAIPDVLPLGDPLSNCEVFLLGEEGFIDRPGGIGEVVIAGDALALEYYNDPARTSERFVRMVTPSGEEKRVFRSGDLARIGENGEMVFSSRSDFQIKHLGKRIELGEIEAVADRLPFIQRCCCVYDPQLQLLKLFCELIPDCGVTDKDIRKALRPLLSDYMLPQKVIILEQMPYNANGKIDRTRLNAFSF